MFGIQLDLKVAAMIKGREWDLVLLRSLLLEEVVNVVFSVPIANSQVVEDKLIWKMTAKGDFFVKSAYSWLVHHDVVP